MHCSSRLLVGVEIITLKSVALDTLDIARSLLTSTKVCTFYLRTKRTFEVAKSVRCDLGAFTFVNRINKFKTSFERNLTERRLINKVSNEVIIIR